MKFGLGVLYKNLLSERDFRANWLIDSHNLLRGLNKFILTLVTCPGRFRPISECKVFTKCCSVKLSFVKIGRMKIFSFRFYMKLRPMVVDIVLRTRTQFGETDVHKNFMSAPKF